MKAAFKGSGSPNGDSDDEAEDIPVVGQLSSLDDDSDSDDEVPADELEAFALDLNESVT